jgi:hypothetical protein
MPVEVIADLVRLVESEQVAEKVSEQPKMMMVTALQKMIIASTSAHAEAGPSDTAPENLAEESLPENPSAPAPKAPSSSDLNFIVRYALGKQLYISRASCRN